MNIKARLSREHSRPLTTAIVKYVGEDKQRLKELTDIFFDEDYRLSQRSAWAFSEVIMAHPGMLKPYYAKLIRKLKGGAQHDAILRNTLRMFQVCDIPEKYEAELVDLCFGFIRGTYAIAIRAFAVTVAARICAKYPELAAELKLLLGDISEHPQSAGMQVRIKRAIKDLDAAVAS